MATGRGTTGQLGRRRLCGVTVAALLIALVWMAPASADSGFSTVGGPWNVRSCASTRCPVVGVMPDGPIPELACQLYGEIVTIGDEISHTWDRVRSPSGATGFMTDIGVEETVPPFDTRLPRCGGAHGGSVYYQPRFSEGDPVAQADFVLPRDGWSFGDCTPFYGGNYPDVVNGRQVTTLAGWSLGRLGPTYLLASNFNRVAASIDSIILYDPGSYADYFGTPWNPFDDEPCDPQYDQSDLYRRWLSTRPTNRLLILAGAVTRDIDSANGEYAHRGIQEALFPDIRGTTLADQVLVCNYNDLDHPAVLAEFSDVVTRGPQSVCPTRPGVRLYASWHP